MQKKFGQKQIPTLLGLAILVLSLIGGIWFIGEGAGVFAPRAAPQTTPKKVKLANVKETGFSVSFITDEATAGFVKYGTEPTSLKSQASDDRDQVTGTVGQYTNHHITLRDLKPDTTYYYTLGTGSTPKYDNNGAPFMAKTPKRLGAPAAAKTIYGTVTSAEGTPVSGALVYASIPGVGPLSSITKESGSWAIPLSTARNTEGTQYASVAASDAIQLTAQGLRGSEGAFASATVETAQPAPPLILSSTVGNSVDLPVSDASGSAEATTGVGQGQDVSALADTAVVNTQDSTLQQTQVATQNPVDATGSAVAQQSLDQGTAVLATDGKTVNLHQDENQIVQTTQPVIIGQAPAKITIQVEIHSDTQITTQAQTDQAGNYSIDIAALQQQLEPGVHTITISYVDPFTKKTVTETRTFIVADKNASLTASAPQPFGTNNPFTLESPNPSPTASASAEPRVTVPATTSATPVSGTTETTFAFILGGLLFVIAGAWSFLHNVESKKVKI
jgi:hypothetical protein